MRCVNAFNNLVELTYVFHLYSLLFIFFHVLYYLYYLFHRWKFVQKCYNKDVILFSGKKNKIIIFLVNTFTRPKGSNGPMHTTIVSLGEITSAWHSTNIWEERKYKERFYRWNDSRRWYQKLQWLLKKPIFNLQFDLLFVYCIRTYILYIFTYVIMSLWAITYEYYVNTHYY